MNVLRVCYTESNSFGDQIIHVVNEDSQEGDVVINQGGSWINLPCLRSHQVWIDGNKVTQSRKW